MHEIKIDPWFIERAKKIRGGRINAYEHVAGPKTALVVVDMQTYFVDAGMPVCVPEARTIVPNINRLAQAIRIAGGGVVWIQNEALTNDSLDWSNCKEALGAEKWRTRQEMLARDGEGFPIYPACEVLPEDRIAAKHRFSAFIPYPSELAGILKQGGFDTLLITGVATSTCCESTARDASMWGYRTIMVSDGNADQTDALHNHSLGKFLTIFGDVQSTDELIAKLVGSDVCDDASVAG